jgi:hypothetical protein
MYVLNKKKDKLYAVNYDTKAVVELGIILRLERTAMGVMTTGGRKVDHRIVSVYLTNRTRLRIPIALFYEEE